MTDAYLKSLLGDREQILLVTRQHWFLLLRNIAFEILLSIATVVAVTVLWTVYGPRYSLVPLGYLLLLIPLASLIRDVVIWNSHKYVVTNRRVVQIFGVFNKNVTDSSLEKVNDVKMEQSVFGRMFNYGDIEILTASELGINRFTTIGDPVKFKTAMLNAKFQLEQGQQAYGAPAAAPQIEAVRMIQELDALRKQGAISEEEFQTKKNQLMARI